MGKYQEWVDIINTAVQNDIYNRLMFELNKQEEPHIRSPGNQHLENAWDYIAEDMERTVAEAIKEL